MDMHWVRHGDDHLQGARRDTDAYLVESPEIQSSIIDTHRVLAKLWDLIPMTPENAFSGNLAPIIEAEHELTTSITLASMGLYKQALTTLRSVLELGLLSVYWDVDDRAHIDIQRWWRSGGSTPQNNDVHKGLKRIPNVAAFLERDPDFFTRLSKTAYFLSGYVHTRGGSHSHGGLVRWTNQPAFAQAALELWVAQLLDVGRVVLAVHLMKYPVGLQVTPLGDKFGLNPPAGGFVEPWVRDLFRDYLLPETRDALQAISDTDQGALDMAAWVNDHEDLSEDDWHAQIETHDRWTIEQGGYENWASVHAQTDEHIRADDSADELATRIAYRERLRDWAAAEGTLTQESAMEATRRRIEAEPSAGG